MVRLSTRLLATLVLSLLLAGCANKPPDQSNNAAPGAAPGSAPAPSKSIFASTTTIPAGTVLSVRLNQAVGSKISQSGESFTATVAEPVNVDGKVVIPDGATANGVVADAIPLGRFKGGARLRLTLNSVTVNGASVPVEASLTEARKGKGKRSAVLIGGGAGLGAVIGALAGGGKGAAIGALAGGGAGTAGAAFTGNKNIVLPAETALGFKLAQPVVVKR